MSSMSVLGKRNPSYACCGDTDLDDTMIGCSFCPNQYHYKCLINSHFYSDEELKEYVNNNNKEWECPQCEDIENDKDSDYTENEDRLHKYTSKKVKILISNKTTK